MAENKKVSELDSIQNLSDNDEFVVIDKSVAFGEDASSTGKTSKVSLAQLKQAVLASGQKGSQGTQGDEGPKGFDGPAGIKGNVGEPGEKGKPGETGPDGSEGGSGERGPKGFIGDDGFEGDPGLPGPSGDKGNSGRKGSPGPKGEKGNTGYKGFPGPQGDPGEVGPVADRGPRGVKGVKGVKGTKGIQGSRGQKGPKGREVGKPGDRGRKPENGLPGDPGESLGSGEKGPQGEKGPKGARGRKGYKGSLGDQGHIGLPPGQHSHYNREKEKTWNVRQTNNSLSRYTTRTYETTDPLFPLTGYYETEDKSIELTTDPHRLYRMFGTTLESDKESWNGIKVNAPVGSYIFNWNKMVGDRNWYGLFHGEPELEGVFIWPPMSGLPGSSISGYGVGRSRDWLFSDRVLQGRGIWGTTLSKVDEYTTYLSTGNIGPYDIAHTDKNYTPQKKYIKKVHAMNTGVKHSQSLFYHELYTRHGTTLNYKTAFRESAHIRIRRNYARIAGFTFNKLTHLKQNKILTEEQVDDRVRYYTKPYQAWGNKTDWLGRNVYYVHRNNPQGLHYDWTSDTLLGTGYDLDRNFLYCIPATDYKFHMHDSIKNWYLKPNVNLNKIQRGKYYQPSRHFMAQYHKQSNYNYEWIFQRQNRSYSEREHEHFYENTYMNEKWTGVTKYRFQLDYSKSTGLNNKEAWRIVELFMRANKPKHLTDQWCAEGWHDARKFAYNDKDGLGLWPAFTTYRHETRLLNSDESYGKRRATVYPTHLSRDLSKTENPLAKWGFFSAELTNAEIWVCSHNESKYKGNTEYFTMERAAAELGDGKHVYDDTGELSFRVTRGFNHNSYINGNAREHFHGDFKWHRVASNAPLVRTEPVPVHLQKLMPETKDEILLQKHQATMEGEQITLVDGPDPFAKEKKVFPFIAPVRNSNASEGCYIHAHHESYGVPHDFKNEYYDPSAHREDAYKLISKLDPIAYKDGKENVQLSFKDWGKWNETNRTFAAAGTNNYGGYYHKDETNNTDINVIKNSAPWSIFDGDLRGSPCASNIENAWGHHKLQLIGTY